VTRAEFDAVASQFKSADGKARPDRGARFFERMDLNKDGVVTKAEMDQAALAAFKAADTNHDGWLSKGELLMVRQKMQPQG